MDGGLTERENSTLLVGQVCYSLLLLWPVHAGHREGQRASRMRIFHLCIPLVHVTLPAWARVRAPLVELDIFRLEQRLHESWTSKMSGEGTISRAKCGLRVAAAQW